MASNKLLSEVHEQLSCRDLPLEYVERSVAELSDHHTDIVEELQREGVTQDDSVRMAADRLGEPRQLAKKIAHDYQRRTFCGRWPLFSFILAPLPMMFFVQVVLFFMFAACITGIDWLGGSWVRTAPKGSLAAALCIGLYGILAVLVPALIALWWGNVALRTTCNRVYTLAVCILIGVFSGGMYHLVFFDTRVGQPTFGFGQLMYISGWDDLVSVYIQPMHFIQLVTPLLAGLLVIAYGRLVRRKSLHVPASLSDKRLAA